MTILPIAFWNTSLCEDPRKSKCQAHRAQVFDIPTVGHGMDADFWVLGEIPLGRREEDNAQTESHSSAT
jgi:hypothetical protein